MREKARAAALSFWRYFHEVRTKNLKAFLLGARRAGVCVLALVVLLSGVSIPAYADFGGTDSTNLANLTTYTKSIWDYIRVTLQSHLSNIYSRLGTMVTHLQSIANNTSASASRLLDISNRITTLTNGLFSRLDSIILLLGGSIEGNYPVSSVPVTSMDSFLTRAGFQVDSGWIMGAWNDPYWVVDSSGSFTDITWNYGWSGTLPNIPYLVPGVYYHFSVSWMGSFSGLTDSGDERFLSLTSQVSQGRVYVDYYWSVSVPTSLYEISFDLSGSFSPGEFYFSIVRDDSYGIDKEISDAVHPGQDEVNQQLQDSVGQLEDFDNKIFTDVSDYTSQLDFGLGDWSEAAAGISYIGSIFMLIWDNSPTQVIVLSLMVGLCLLILGRGPRVAGEVRRHEERASRRKKGG